MLCREELTHRPETAVLRNVCLQGWPFAGSWEPGFWEDSYHFIRMTHAPKLFVQTIWFMWNTCFPPRSLEFWYVIGRGYLPDQSLRKTLLNLEWAYPVDRILHVIIHFWRGYMYLCDSPGKRLLESFVCLFFIPYAFSFCCFSFVSFCFNNECDSVSSESA